jgi:invasion protein IalB
MKRALVLFSVIATYITGVVEAAGDPRAAQLTYERWNKMCLKHVDGKPDCFIGAGARGACYPSGGGIAIAVMNEKSASLSAMLGTKHTLEGAISVQIDQDIPILIPHPECIGLGCGGRIDIDGGFIERLKNGRVVTVEATDAAHQKLRLSLALADFAKAYDGPGKEPKLFEEILTTEQMKEQMERAEKEKPPQCEE